MHERGGSAGGEVVWDFPSAPVYLDQWFLKVGLQAVCEILFACEP